MTLFVQRPRRIFSISDAYVLVVSALIFFSVGVVLRGVLEKRKNMEEEEDTNLFNPRGGAGIGLAVSDDSELSNIILTCIADNERYIIKSKELRELIFRMVKAKITEESLIITPNLIRFLAVRLINPEQTLIVQIGNTLLSSDNRVRLYTRAAGGAIIGLLTGLMANIPYAILLILIHFNITQNCGYPCPDYFQHISQKEEAIQIYAENSEDTAGHIFIGENQDARQVEIYVPSKSPEEISMKNSRELKKTRTYQKSRKKMKVVNFSDFRKSDPVLSTFKNLEEPTVLQKPCTFDELRDIIDVQIE